MQTLHVIGQQVLQVGLGLAAADIDHAHVGDVEDPAVAAHLMVFLDLRAIVQRHVPATEVDHLGAQGEVQVIERGALSHGYLLPGLAELRASC
ncbi:hypothetical protein D3C86_1717630 [compost metagenome]